MARVARRGRLTDPYVEGLAKPGFHRDGVLPGFGVRIGRRKKSFEVRIERRGRQKVFETLGHWPVMKAEEARAQAHDILARYERREAIKVPRQGEPTIANLWPMYEKWLKDDGKSEATLVGYSGAYKRLSEDVKYRSLAELADDPTIMGDEQERIREKLKGSRRGGMAAATQSARFVGALSNWAVEKRGLKLSASPVRGARTVDPRRRDLPVLGQDDMKAWCDGVLKLPNEVERWALIFTLLSGLRRDTVANMEWRDLQCPIRKRLSFWIRRPKGGEDRGFDLILSRAMIRCLWRAREAGRRLHSQNSQRWVFPSALGHIRGDHLTKLGVKANHALRRGYATAATNAGVDEQTVGRLLNHGGKSITSRYIPTSHIGRMLAGAQQDISAHIVRAIGSPPEIA
jgi:integrase